MNKTVQSVRIRMLQETCSPHSLVIMIFIRLASFRGLKTTDPAQFADHLSAQLNKIILFSPPATRSKQN